MMVFRLCNLSGQTRNNSILMRYLDCIQSSRLMESLEPDHLLHIAAEIILN